MHEPSYWGKTIIQSRVLSTQITAWSYKDFLTLRYSPRNTMYLINITILIPQVRSLWKLTIGTYILVHH